MQNEVYKKLEWSTVSTRKRLPYAIDPNEKPGLLKILKEGFGQELHKISMPV